MRGPGKGGASLVDQYDLLFRDHLVTGWYVDATLMQHLCLDVWPQKLRNRIAQLQDGVWTDLWTKLPG